MLSSECRGPGKPTGHPRKQVSFTLFTAWWDQYLSVPLQIVTTISSLTVIPMVSFVGGWVLLWRPQVGCVGNTSLEWELTPHRLMSCSASHSAFTGTTYSKYWPSVFQKLTARTFSYIPSLYKCLSLYNTRRRLSS